MASPSRVVSIFRPGLLRDKVAIVTGGGTGIGRAIAQELVHLGCKVVISSRKFENLKQAADSIISLEKDVQSGQDEEKRVLPVQCNIRKEDEVKGLFQTTLEQFGRVDYLVNNGGGQFIGKLESLSLKGWNAVIETNLTGTYLCCRQAYQSWMGEHGGAIVNIVMDFWNGFPMFGHSAAARAGVDNLTKTMSLEWASSGIRINSIAPGVIYSDTAAANYSAVDPELFNRARSQIPQKRLGTVEEVSALAVFLLSPGASFITGETVKIDGAQSLYGHSFEVSRDHSNSPAYRWDNASDKSKL